MLKTGAEHLDARGFRQLRLLARELLASGDRAVAMLEFMLHEAKTSEAWRRSA